MRRARRPRAGRRRLGLGGGLFVVLVLLASAAPMGVVLAVGFVMTPFTIGAAAACAPPSASNRAVDAAGADWDDGGLGSDALRPDPGHPENGAGPCEPGRASGDAAYPLASPAPITDGVGPRPCRVTGSSGCSSSTWHPALDFGAPCGTPVLAARPGTVTVVSEYWVSVTTADGVVVSYLHMYASDVVVHLGDAVEAGETIGAVGSAGPSTGCHLDLRVNTLNTINPTVAALPHIGDASVPAGYVDPSAFMHLYGIDLLVGGVQ